MFAYDRELQFKDPREGVPIVYTDYGKTVSHYGGLRIAPHQAVAYAAWENAKQLAWDRARDKDGELCYICYYDAGTSAYRGFMKVLLTPEERREHYSGVSLCREELLGDTLELALGVLKMAMRYPSHFPNWGGLDGANACVWGLGP